MSCRIGNRAPGKWRSRAIEASITARLAGLVELGFGLLGAAPLVALECMRGVDWPDATRGERCIRKRPGFRGVAMLPTVDRVYLDMSSLKRPFDDQRQERIRREALAVAWILEQVEQGAAVLVRSPAMTVENDANPREDRRLAAALWLKKAAFSVPHQASVGARARELVALGFGTLDALHITYAEIAEARWFVTCDDKLRRLASAHATRLSVAVMDPCDYMRRNTL